MFHATLNRHSPANTPPNAPPRSCRWRQTLSSKHPAGNLAEPRRRSFDRDVRNIIANSVQQGGGKRKVAPPEVTRTIARAVHWSLASELQDTC